MELDNASSYEFPTAAAGDIEGYINAAVSKGESFFAEGEPVPSVWQDGTKLDIGAHDSCITAITSPREDDAEAPEITTNEIPEGKTGENYSFTFEASGSEVIEWRSGNIPEGFVWNSAGKRDA